MRIPNVPNKGLKSPTQRDDSLQNRHLSRSNSSKRHPVRHSDSIQRPIPNRQQKRIFQAEQINYLNRMSPHFRKILLNDPFFNEFLPFSKFPRLWESSIEAEDFQALNSLCEILLCFWQLAVAQPRKLESNGRMFLIKDICSYFAEALSLVLVKAHHSMEYVNLMMKMFDLIFWMIRKDAVGVIRLYSILNAVVQSFRELIDKCKLSNTEGINYCKIALMELLKFFYFENHRHQEERQRQMSAQLKTNIERSILKLINDSLEKDKIPQLMEVMLLYRVELERKVGRFLLIPCDDGKGWNSKNPPQLQQVSNTLRQQAVGIYSNLMMIQNVWDMGTSNAYFGDTLNRTMHFYTSNMKDFLKLLDSFDTLTIEFGSQSQNMTEKEKRNNRRRILEDDRIRDLLIGVQFRIEREVQLEIPYKFMKKAIINFEFLMHLESFLAQIYQQRADFFKRFSREYLCLKDEKLLKANFFETMLRKQSPMAQLFKDRQRGLNLLYEALNVELPNKINSYRQRILKIKKSYLSVIARNRKNMQRLEEDRNPQNFNHCQKLLKYRQFCLQEETKKRIEILRRQKVYDSAFSIGGPKIDLFKQIQTDQETTFEDPEPGRELLRPQSVGAKIQHADSYSEEKNLDFQQRLEVFLESEICQAYEMYSVRKLKHILKQTFEHKDEHFTTDRLLSDKIYKKSIFALIFKQKVNQEEKYQATGQRSRVSGRNREKSSVGNNDSLQNSYSYGHTEEQKYVYTVQNHMKYEFPLHWNQLQLPTNHSEKINLPIVRFEIFKQVASYKALFLRFPIWFLQSTQAIMRSYLKSNWEKILKLNNSYQFTLLDKQNLHQKFLTVEQMENLIFVFVKQSLQQNSLEKLDLFLQQLKSNTCKTAQVMCLFYGCQAAQIKSPLRDKQNHTSNPSPKNPAFFNEIKTRLQYFLAKTLRHRQLNELVEFSICSLKLSTPFFIDHLCLDVFLGALIFKVEFWLNLINNCSLSKIFWDEEFQPNLNAFSHSLNLIILIASSFSISQSKDHRRQDKPPQNPKSRKEPLTFYCIVCRYVHTKLDNTQTSCSECNCGIMDRFETGGRKSEHFSQKREIYSLLKSLLMVYEKIDSKTKNIKQTEAFKEFISETHGGLDSQVESKRVEEEFVKFLRNGEEFEIDLTSRSLFEENRIDNCLVAKLTLEVLEKAINDLSKMGI